MLAVTSDKDQQALADQLDKTVVPSLKDIDGVGQVTVDGVRDLRSTSRPTTGRWPRRRRRAGAEPVLQAGGATLPAGSFDEDGKNRTVQVGGGFTSLRQIENLMITGEGVKKPVRLDDIATVKQQPSRPTRSPAPTAAPASRSWSPWTTTAPRSPSRTRSRTSCPTSARTSAPRAKLTVVSDQGPAVAKSISGLTTEGALGLLFAVLVILVFLASIRSTLVTAVSIPLSVVLALIVLWTRDLS